MNFLVDTNVLSEVTRAVPNPQVLSWLDRLDEDRAFISVITLAEIRRGIAIMPDGRRRASLLDWLEKDLPQRFEHRIVPINPPVAFAWGDLMGRARQVGRGLSSMDGLIAATAIVGSFTLATRNTKDFDGFDIPLINPWIASA